MNHPFWGLAIWLLGGVWLFGPHLDHLSTCSSYCRRITLPGIYLFFAGSRGSEHRRYQKKAPIPSVPHLAVPQVLGNSNSSTQQRSQGTAVCVPQLGFHCSCRSLHSLWQALPSLTEGHGKGMRRENVGRSRWIDRDAIWCNHIPQDPTGIPLGPKTNVRRSSPVWYDPRILLYIGHVHIHHSSQDLSLGARLRADWFNFILHGEILDWKKVQDSEPGQLIGVVLGENGPLVAPSCAICSWPMGCIK